MPTSLYLDTARLGRISRKAQQAHLDFVRLAAEEPSSLYFERFLQQGSDAWPDRYRRRFPGLVRWHGVGELKRRLARVAGFREASRVLIASRSAQLMVLGARLLSSTCRKVLTTDFSWPTYQNILRLALDRSGNRFHVTRLRNAVMRGHMSAAPLVELLTQSFVENECDGLFLPVVDNLGTRLPVGDIVRSIRRKAELRFVVVDAAQAFAHVPLGDCLSVADFMIAGCHKWLRGYFPLGLAFYDQSATRELIDRTTLQMLRAKELDDPLLRFSGQLCDDELDGYSETVNLGPLFSCCGAVADAPSTALMLNDSLLRQRANADVVIEIARETDWRPVMPERAFRSGILLLDHRSTHPTTGDDLRRQFQRHGIIVTTYDDGVVRLSMPRRPFSQAEVETLRRVLSRRSSNARVSLAVDPVQAEWIATR